MLVGYCKDIPSKSFNIPFIKGLREGKLVSHIYFPEVYENAKFFILQKINLKIPPN